MRYPEFLSRGGRIGFIAPSFAPTTEPYYSCFGAAKKRFADMGYRLVDGPNCTADCGFGKSNTPEKCGEEINDFFVNDRCDVIISCGGGETMCEDLPYVDFDAIAKARPKWYMGYSDNTNLTFTLPTLCDTAAVYAPCATSFGQETWHKSLYDAFGTLTGDVLSVSSYDGWESEQIKDETRPLVPYNITEPFRLVAENYRTPFEGRFLGGCMDCLITLCGTRFDKVKEFNARYADDGVIWFLESCDLTMMSVRRALWQMKQAGWFDRAKGFLIGRPLHFDEPFMGMDRHEAVMSAIGDLGLPVIMDVDLGHLPPMMPVISGGYGRVTVDDKVTIDWELK